MIEPRRVPARIRVTRRVTGDWPVFHETVVEPGEYDCESNIHGAVSVKATNGKMLGLKPREFTVLRWRKNHGVVK